MKRHSIKPHQPLRFVLLTLIACTVIGVGIWLLAEYSHWHLIREQLAQNQDHKSLWQANEELSEENERLRQKLTMLKTGVVIDKRATAELQDEVVELQDEIFKLTRELEFYRGIISSSEDVKGLAVQGLELQPTRVPNQYRFKLVLTHVEKNDKVVEGAVKLALEGTENGNARTLQLTDIIRDKSRLFEYRFKHFKRFEGFVNLPPDFKPSRVQVNLLPKGNSHARIERIFDWPDITG